MASQKDFPEGLERVDFGPLRVRVEVLEGYPGRVDAVLQIDWPAPETRWGDPSTRGSRHAAGWESHRGGQGDRSERFEASFATGRSLRDVRHAAWQVWDRPQTGSEAHRLLVMPYLNRSALDLLREMGVSGLDLCGNGIIQAAGWWFYQHGNPNQYSAQRSRAPYRGKSALVGRALLLRPWYEAIGDVRDEIQRRGTSISLSQVSKVLTALEDDLVVRKKGHCVRLLQPKALLDALVDAYDPPRVSQTLEAKAALGPGLFCHLRERADAAGVRIVGVDPQRYVVAPQSRERLEVYVEPGLGADLGEAFGLEPASRFSNVVIRVADEPGVYFDPVEADGFWWAPPLEVYLELMQGGKREQEIARDLRPHLLRPHTT